MSIINTACSCGQKVQVLTGKDADKSYRTDGKQAVYPGESGYCIFRCVGCGKPLDETVPEFAYEKSKTIYCRFDGMTWPMANQATADLSHELRYGDRKNIAAASVVDAYIELINCSPEKREQIVKNIRKEMATN